MTSPFFLHRPDIDNFVLIHTMGKVGSMALTRSLENVNMHCRHTHWVATETEAFFDRLAQVSATGQTNWSFYVQNRLNIRRARSALADAEYASLIKLITAIRAPIEQILSHLFQSLPVCEAALREKELEVNAASIRTHIRESVALYMENPNRTVIGLTAELAEHNCEQILFCWLVHNYLHWFDEEFRPFCKADILAGQPRDGFQIADNVLILKFEDLSTQAERAVALYAQRPRFKMMRTNTAVQTSHGDLYREVVGTIRFPAEFVDHLCNSAYVRHFYGEEERQAMRKKWTD
jgi:hypothetical protein